MTTIKVSYNVSDSAIARIEAVVEKTLNHDCNWNGASIEIERADWTCVECNDEADGVLLLAKVNQAIDQE